VLVASSVLVQATPVALFALMQSIGLRRSQDGVAK
jgi:hypothetical protein